ncbi:VIT1/CCC1 transporter family protein [Roseomonas sp. CAU 1739]|uniref:VIT1/CCC1 transporter family protein n=1 Tax=Roseomonas sp. CAU 1739 TaxID=3140364 RepID=UPI00325BD202
MPPGPPHEEQHFSQTQLVRDAVAGAAGGLVLPFALAAGLAGVLGSNPPIVAAGLAVAAAGSIATALGGYLAARGEADHYAAERRREEEETVDYADRERWEVAAILHRYGVRGNALRLAVDSICADTRRWVDFMMRFELDLKEPEPQRAARSAAMTGIAHAAGGIVALVPYMAMDGVRDALGVSCAVAAIALAGLGWMKARGAGLPPLRGAIQTVGTGFAAAALAALVVQAAGG